MFSLFPAEETPAAPMAAGKPDKPKPAVEQILPVEEVKEPAEPPQIKVPMEVPERKKDEEVQLDRPGAGKLLKKKVPACRSVLSYTLSTALVL